MRWRRKRIFRCLRWGIEVGGFFDHQQRSFFWLKMTFQSKNFGN
jgi:hypothetical protein